MTAPFYNIQIKPPKSIHQYSKSSVSIKKIKIPRKHIALQHLLLHEEKKTQRDLLTPSIYCYKLKDKRGMLQGKLLQEKH
jgi:hypothetical protein